MASQFYLQWSKEKLIERITFLEEIKRIREKEISALKHKNKIAIEIPFNSTINKSINKIK